MNLPSKNERIPVTVTVSKKATRCTAKSNVANIETWYSEYNVRFLVAQPEIIGLLD
jgi:hypothetical protein